MARLTPEQAASKLISRGTAAVTDFVNGVKNVQVSPTEEAAKNVQKAKTKYMEAVDSGKMERGLRRITKEAWIAVTAQKGQERMATGLAAAKPKMVSFFTQFLPYADQVSKEVAAMPSTSLEDNINRMTTAVRRLAQFQRT